MEGVAGWIKIYIYILPVFCNTHTYFHDHDNIKLQRLKRLSIFTMKTRLVELNTSLFTRKNTTLRSRLELKLLIIMQCNSIPES